MSQELPTTEINIVHRHRYLVAAHRFKLKLWKKRDSIAALIKYHLRLQADDTCIVLPKEQWMNGCFNVCVHVEVTAGNSTRKLIFRCPVPPLAGQQAPGRNDEKLGCEVGMYIYMQQNCPDIRIPELFAFGFTDDSSFVHVQQTPIYTRLWRKAWKWIYRCLGYPTLSDYIHEKAAPAVGTAYMLMEHIGPETGKMLSNTLFNESTDAARRKNLFTGLARTMLSLARVPQQQIGSFRFNTLDCTIALSNRPLTCTMAVFEQEGTTATIPEDRTYQNTDSFVSDMLAMHDNRLIHNPHAVVDADDAKDRIAILSLLRVVNHFFVLPERRSGPYFLQATDMHASNILVDEEWNITCIIDLEWICALPVEMMHVPTWIIKRSTEAIIDHYEEFDEARMEFMSIMEQEMKHVKMEHEIPITQIMRDSWESKGMWYWLCIEAVNLWLFLFEDHIMPMFSSNKGLVSELKQLFRFWHKGANKIIKMKAADEKRYQSELRSLVESGQTLPKI